jgi:hypothetical protein
MIHELNGMISGMKAGSYPDFVRKDVEPEKIPVFSFHNIEAGTFGLMLKYLQENGYETLNAEDYRRSAESGEYDRRVLLTFDDGLVSLYKAAFPLLKQYGMSAVAFIMPVWIGKPGIIDWDQAREMHEQGSIDFQSHSLSHSAIPVRGTIGGFYTENRPPHPAWNIAVLNPLKGEAEFTYQDGDPVFPFASRLSDHKRFDPDPSVIRFCRNWMRDHVRSSGKGDAWQRPLRRAVRAYTDDKIEGETENKASQRKAIRHELSEAKKEIESRLQGKQVCFLGYPWNEAGSVTASLLEECGYTAAFGGLNTGRLTGAEYIRRMSGDYIFRLPGTGRRPFASIVFGKIRRRIVKGTMY